MKKLKKKNKTENTVKMYKLLPCLCICYKFSQAGTTYAHNVTSIKNAYN